MSVICRLIFLLGIFHVKNYSGKLIYQYINITKTETLNFKWSNQLNSPVNHLKLGVSHLSHPVSSFKPLQVPFLLNRLIRRNNRILLWLKFCCLCLFTVCSCSLLDCELWRTWKTPQEYFTKILGVNPIQLKEKQKQQKNRQKTWTDISPRRQTANRNIKKVHITNHQENVNQSHNELSPHSY